jgi:hypothetical protein
VRYEQIMKWQENLFIVFQILIVHASIETEVVY